MTERVGPGAYYPPGAGGGAGGGVTTGTITIGGTSYSCKFIQLALPAGSATGQQFVMAIGLHSTGVGATTYNGRSFIGYVKSGAAWRGVLVAVTSQSILAVTTGSVLPYQVNFQSSALQLETTTGGHIGFRLLSTGEVELSGTDILLVPTPGTHGGATSTYKLQSGKISFSGAKTPIVRPTLPATATAAQIRTALINLGLCQ